jgi:hypothetical protein
MTDEARPVCGSGPYLPEHALLSPSRAFLRFQRAGSSGVNAILQTSRGTHVRPCAAKLGRPTLFEVRWPSVS